MAIALRATLTDLRREATVLRARSVELRASALVIRQHRGFRGLS